MKNSRPRVITLESSKRRYAGNRTYNPHFEKSLDQASYWEAVVSAWLARQGFKVIHNPIIQSPLFSLDTVDLEVESMVGTHFRRARIEVKFVKGWASMDMQFICSRASADNKGHVKDGHFVNVAYVLVDPDHTIRCVVPGTPVVNMQRWDKRPQRNEIFEAYHVKPSDVKDKEELVSWLKLVGVYPLPPSAP